MKVFLSKTTNTKVKVVNFNELTTAEKKWFLKSDLSASATVTAQGKTVLHLTAQRVRPNLKRIIYGPSQAMLDYFLPKSQSIIDVNKITGGLEELRLEHKQESLFTLPVNQLS